MRQRKYLKRCPPLNKRLFSKHVNLSSRVRTKLNEIIAIDSSIKPILIIGDSATRTLTARWLANRTGWPLYRVDLSTVISKYIGETEKNLEKVFSEVERKNWILFFDEADALFEKRTKVSDGHDRFANVDTSWLLQKIENYEGLVILASNKKEKISNEVIKRLKIETILQTNDDEDDDNSD